jgi:hypothetical protein
MAFDVEFQINRSNLFRIVHADGVFGGIAPTGLIFINFYSQVPPIPDRMFHEIEPDGKLGKEVIGKRSGTSAAIVRELEVGVLIDVAVAKSFIQWLQDKVAAVEQLGGSALGQKES